MPKRQSKEANNSSSFANTLVIERNLKSATFKNPVVICGFVGPGLAGLTAAGYIIGHLQLHEAAHVMSRYIPPSVIFIGGKIRNPFRIYRDTSGSLAVVICEVPVVASGLFDISSSLIRWFGQSNPSEFVVLDGIPIESLPETRPTFYVANEERQNGLKSLGFLPAEATLIGGTAGSILSECVARDINCLSLLAPVSITLMDPGAPLALVSALNLLYKLNIATSELEQDVEMVHNELNEIRKQYQKLQEQANAAKGDGSNGGQNMYR